jgi:hypothetical protein
MKERNDIDKLLRASLDGYRPAPPATGKDKFLDDAAGALPGKRRPGAFWVPLSVAILLLGLTGGIGWYLLNSSESSTKILGDGVTASEVKTANVNDQLKQNANPNDKPTIVEVETINQNLTDHKGKTAYAQPLPETGIREAVSITQPLIEDEPANPVPGERLSDTLASPDAPTETQAGDSEIPPAVPTDSTGETGISPDEIGATISEISGEITDPVTHPEGEKSMYGIFYKPDFLYNIEDNKKLMHTLGVEYQFRLSHPRYVVRAGLGISLSPGYYDYGVDYNEYMGSYLRLDSVTFNLAEDNYHLESTYHQTEAQVWDSTLQTLYLTTDKRFAYLFIPVSIGYDIYSSDRISLGFRAGPSLSVLLNKKPEDPEYDPGQDQVLQVSLLTPLRNVVNWQLAGGLNFTFFTRNNYFIEMEPSFSWYFKQLSGDESSGKNPYGIGIRISAGILPKK